MRTTFLLVSILLLLAGRAEAADEETIQQYDRILTQNGIEPTPEGILNYLSPLNGKRLKKLIAQLGHRDYAKREQATQLLSALPTLPEAALERATTSPDPEIRYRARIVIERSKKGKNSTVMQVALLRIRGKEFAKAVPLLLELIPQFSRSDLVSAASQALRSVAQKSHADLLRKTLYSSKHTQLRIAVLHTLGSIGEKSLLPDLKKLNKDQDERIRLAAAASLLRLKEREGLLTLAELLKSDNVQVRADAITILQAAVGRRFNYLAVDKSPARNRAANEWIAWVSEHGATAKLNHASPKKLLGSHGRITGGTLKEKMTGHSSTVYCIVFSPDGKLLASSSGDRTIKVWNVATQKLAWSIDPSDKKYAKDAHSTTIRSVAFSPDGTILASASYDHTIKFWDVKTRKLIRTLTGHTSSLRIIQFSPDGKLLASSSTDNTVRLWNVATGKTVHVLSGHTQTVRSVAFRSDGLLLASSSSDRSIRLWNVKTGAHLKTLTGHTSSVRSVAFSPNNRTLVSCSLDNTVRLWDVFSGKERVTLRGHSLSVKCVDFDQRGRFIISAGNDRTVRIWDPYTGKQTAALSGPTSSLWHCAISPDGNLVAAAGSDRSIYLWGLKRSAGP